MMNTITSTITTKEFGSQITYHLNSIYYNNAMIFQLQGTLVDEKPPNIFAKIIPGQKCEWASTGIPVIITPANA
jgi:hypothetical protein